MIRTKTEWRRALLAARSAVGSREREAAQRLITARVQALPAASSPTILVYRAIGAEVDPHAIAAWAVADGRAVLEPVVDGLEPAWARWSVNPSPPAGARAAQPTGPMLVVCPGVGFDLAGVRLGRGRGWYDRALAALRAAGPVVAVGLAFELQVTAELPRAPWDATMDVVVTERRVIVPARPVSGRGGFRPPAGEVRGS